MELTAQPASGANRYLLVLALSALVLVSCGAESDVPTLSAAPTSSTVRMASPSTDPSTTTNSSSASTATTTPPVAATAPTTTASAAVKPPADTDFAALVGGRVRAFFAARAQVAALTSPEPVTQLIAPVAIGNALETVKRESDRRLAAGLTVQSGTQKRSQLRVGRPTINGSNVLVSACAVEDVQETNATTGAVVSTRLTTRNYRVDLTQVDGQWLVSSFAVLQQWEGVAGCALAPADFPN